MGRWLQRIKHPKRTPNRYLCTSRLISYADRKAGGPSYFCRRTEYPSVERPGTVPAVVLCGSAVACSCRPSLFRVAGRTGTGRGARVPTARSEEHTSELQSLMRISYAVFCLKKKKHNLQIVENRRLYT